MLLLVCAAACKPAGGGDARATFNLTCAKCHGEDGRAHTEQGKLVGAKDLTRDEARKMTDADIARQISLGKNRMPAFGNVFSEADIAGLIQQVRRIQSESAAPGTQGGQQAGH